MAAKRWGAPDALQEGLIVQACSEDTLFGAHGPLADRLPLTGRLLLTPTLRCVPEESLAYATAQAKLAAGPALRRNYMAIKHKAKGQVARMVMVSTTGRFPTAFPRGLREPHTGAWLCVATTGAHLPGQGAALGPRPERGGHSPGQGEVPVPAVASNEGVSGAAGGRSGGGAGGDAGGAALSKLSCNQEQFSTVLKRL